MIRIGVDATPLVAIVASFIGTTLAVQGGYVAAELGATAMLGHFIALGGVREMAPIIAGAMVAAKSGAAIASELASMRHSEQIDAIEIMGIDSIRLLISPIVVATITITPLLVTIAVFFCIASATLVATAVLHIDRSVFLEGLIAELSVDDLVFGIIKGAVFGMIVVFVSSYFGYHAKSGPDGIAHATNRSVVVICILAIFFNFIFTSIVYGG